MDTWLDEKALRDQKLGISATQVWLDDGGMVVGYYTLLPTVVREQQDAGIWKLLKPRGPFYGEVY
uniref:hypothetical protein n=1 Tax=Nocardia pseudovaccinii TaxID=189540 RepID=UPI000ACA9B44